MPAFYAHHEFGERVSSRISGDLEKVVQAHRKQFDIGLQGPDVFFFYRPYAGGGWVARQGHHLHEISALPFFEHALDVIAEKGIDSKEYAYLLGFICHFILDSQCHGYVNQMKAVLGVSHMEIEEEFEKFLLRRASKDPVGYSVAELIPVDLETAEAIAPFYHRVTPQIALQSLRDLQMVKKLFTAPGVVKQGLLNGALRLTFHFADMKGLMNQRKDNPKCSKTNAELGRMLEEAVPLALDMVSGFDESLRTGTELNPRFDRNFL